MSAKKRKRSTPKGDVLVSKFPLRLSVDQRILVDRLRQEAARLWNDILDYHWLLWNTQRVWSDEKTLKKTFNAKSGYGLHSQTIQALIELYQETCERTRDLRASGNTNWKYPWRHKQFFPVKYKQAAIHFDGEDLVLSNGRWVESLRVKLPKHIDPGAIKSAEIVWHYNQYWLHVAAQQPKKQAVQGHGVAGGDPGEIHALTLSDGKHHVILTGKELRSLHRLRNKKMAWFDRQISRTASGSNRRTAWVEKKRRFLAWIDRKIEYVEHALSKQAVEWCLDHGVNTLYIGNPEGVQRNTKNKRPRLTNQKLSQWSFGELFRKIRYKGNLHGIVVERVDESYTSGTCPACGHYHKQSKRKFHCPNCHATGHRDVVGAVNIRDKSLHGKMTMGRALPTFKETTYRRVRLSFKGRTVA